jgi:hypothetical protein
MWATLFPREASMAGDEILSNKMADANRRMEEEEADARKPYHAMMDRNRELAAQDAAKIEARDVALFTIAGSVKAMNAMNLKHRS